ncbi:hypothetical protein AKJ45_03145 [candidate division MSBL1 archaeon SCGC-AAA261F19]|uniref:Cytochrome c maturation protein CcmE n=1 Tax=candidate division MSBL1 archaeon SCGC-AAA261F19 TaxID=1698275 RepID=A0A133V8W9_9EURY|nr:hypothetical protein AKJ45_03145 [candidate division MSBL1 archaeon SCGC-AAA261F19]
MRKKKLILGLVVLIAIIFILARGGSSPRPYRTVSELKTNAEDFYGKKVQVAGSVVSWMPENNVVIITDWEENLKVEMKENPPETLEEGKRIAATGILRRADGGPYLASASIEVGCKSEYREEKKE